MENVENVFEYASKSKLRFNYRGVITTEDLWDLKVEDLDSIFKGLNAQMKMSQEESLLNKRTKQEEEVEIKIEIVKYIVGVKLEERDRHKKEIENREKRKHIQELLAEKQDANLRGKSEEELKAMLEDLK